MRLGSILCAFVALSHAGTRLFAETEMIEFRVGRPAEITIDSKVDDRNFADPRAYRHHGAASRIFQRRLTLTNTGAVPLTGPLLVINDSDWSRADALRQALNPSAPASEWLPRLFTFWCNHISHADSDAPGGKEPLALLNFWGYALCGDATAAFTHLATSQGVPARKIPLNGHVAAEYFYDDAWHILDTDQNVVYLRLDNRTLASAADLRADPLLARRAKVFGRYASTDLAASAFNTSLHEFVQPADGKPVSHKKPPAPVRPETLYPGEKMIVYCDQAPGRAVGRTDLSQWGSVREDALCLIEFVIAPSVRPSSPTRDTIHFTSGYPILSAVNHTTGKIVTTPAGQPTFEIAVKFRAPSDQISIYAQRAKASLPMIQKGRNTFRLSSIDPRGKATLIVEWEPTPADLIVPTATATLTDASPAFSVATTPGADLIWWQVAESAAFDFVPPNFDSITSPLEKITFDPLTATFLNPNQSYFFRIKARQAGVWSEWSAPLEFRTDKPLRPAPVTVSAVTNRLRLTWPHAGEGCEYLVFGSNRLDFVPEPFAAEEIVAMRDAGIEKSRPNRNLVGVVTEPEIKLEPNFHFYRVITRRAGVLSVPGDLITTPPEFAAKLPPALVLQGRWRRVGDTDEHLATEMPLRPKAPK